LRFEIGDTVIQHAGRIAKFSPAFVKNPQSIASWLSEMLEFSRHPGCTREIADYCGPTMKESAE
jgi:hypothetical protein